MTIGAGKYDDICTMVRSTTDAEMVLLIIARGNRGEGFSVQCTDPQLLADLPGVLRSVADQIEADTLKHMS